MECFVIHSQLFAYSADLCNQLFICQHRYLNRPVLCAVSNTSGLAGIAHWMNTYYKLKGDGSGVLPVRSPIPKRDVLIPAQPYSQAVVEFDTAL